MKLQHFYVMGEQEPHWHRFYDHNAALKRLRKRNKGTFINRGAAAVLKKNGTLILECLPFMIEWPLSLLILCILFVCLFLSDWILLKQRAILKVCRKWLYLQAISILLSITCVGPSFSRRFPFCPFLYRVKAILVASRNLSLPECFISYPLPCSHKI